MAGVAFRASVIAWVLVGGLCHAAEAVGEKTTETPVVAAAPHPLLNTVREAWQKRQTACEGARVEYSTQFQVNKGEKPQTYGTFGKISIAGKRMRFELGGKRLVDGELVDQPYVSSFDGRIAKTLFWANSGTKYPAGFVHSEPAAPDVSTWETLPVRWALTPLLPEMSQISLDELTVLAEDDMQVGTQCAVLELRQTGPPGVELMGGHIMRCWLDPEQGYAIRRQTQQDETIIYTQMDCSYQSRELGGQVVWVPHIWTSWRFEPNGEPSEIAVSRVTRWDLNPEFPADEFAISFPVGSVVSDSRPNPKIGRTGTYDYVVMPGGVERQITWEERFATYDQLLKTASGGASIPTRRSLGWFVRFNLALIPLFVTLALLRRWLHVRQAGAAAGSKLE